MCVCVCVFLFPYMLECYLGVAVGRWFDSLRCQRLLAPQFGRLLLLLGQTLLLLKSQRHLRVDG